LRKRIGTSAAENKNARESGRRRTPVATAESPSGDREEEMDNEEQAGLQQELEEEGQQCGL
jgi:hypothetical protein